MDKTLTSHINFFLNSQECLLAATALSYILMMVSILGFWGALSLHLFPVFLALLVRLKLKPIKKKGMIAFLPEGVKNMLLHSSLFDTLCNIWFVPKVSLFIKRFFVPFILDINRKQAYRMFHELSPAFAKTLKRRGFVHFMPPKLRSFILGPTEHFKRINFVSGDDSTDHSEPDSAAFSNFKLNDPRKMYTEEVISCGGPY
jgi:hypothetical protein